MPGMTELEIVARHFAIKGPDADGFLWFILTDPASGNRAAFNLGRAQHGHEIAANVALGLEKARRAALAELRKRDDQGRYDHEGDWDRLCVCGHTLGVHAGASPTECFLHTFADYTEERRSHINQPSPDCGCKKFRPKKSKGKFIYLAEPTR